MSLLQRIYGKFSSRQAVGTEFETASYSQEGEDILLRRIFHQVNNGFYVDIGAHHPHRFSNTYFFYKLGWTGINIDPIPGIKELFDLHRPKDINVEAAISDTRSVLNYYNFKEKALNTFSEELAKQYQEGSWELENILRIETVTLAEILDRSVPEGKKISFMSIDVEGFELNVLNSNDWEKYRPEVLLIEMLDCPLVEIAGTDIAKYLGSKGYTVFAKTVNTVFFKLAI